MALSEPLGRNNCNNNDDRGTGTVSHSPEQWDYGSGTRAGPPASHNMLPGLHPMTVGWWKEVLLGVKQGQTFNCSLTHPGPRERTQPHSCM